MLCSFPFELKQAAEDGTFTGLASVYGVVDQVGDIVERGAFTRTLTDSGKERPILWQHNTPIGLCTLTDSPTALQLTGKLSLGIQAARDAYQLLKDGVVKGLSIGFQTVREEFVGDVRHLKELRLWEVSLVTFPACPPAVVTGYKNHAHDENISRALRSLKGDVLRALEGK